MLESIIVLVTIGVAAALLACHAKKTLSGADGCGCGKDKGCAVKSLDALFSGDTAEEYDDDEKPA